MDIVFIEGFHSLIAKRKDVPKIITAKDQNGLEQTLEGTVQPILAIAGIVAKNSSNPTYNNIPIIKVPEDGQKLVELVKKQLTKAKPKNRLTEETAMAKRAALILAGGKARRFQSIDKIWQDKALAELSGKPLLIHAIENVARRC